MSVQTLPRLKEAAPFQLQPPPLNTGDHMSRVEFEQRYWTHPEIKQAELIEGVVYVASPVRYKQHAHPHFDLITWLGVYRAATPGVSGGDNATLRLDRDNEPQPDAILRLEPEHGGRSTITADGYLEGPPELIVEIAASSASYDRHAKWRAYARNGVQEYLIVQVYEQKIEWFALHETDYEALSPDAEGILHSEVFPGLYLNPAAFWAGDLATMLAALQEGLASPAHAAFVERLRWSQPTPQNY
jgi:Uma2 family endonuclease